MSLLPNPRATIVRNVLLFPADGTEPRIIPKTFSEAASKANPVSFYTTSVDLRSHYGKQMATTFVQFLTSHPNPITLECNEGEFLCYYNVSPELPINQSAGRIIGIDPIAFESKVFWRGDIIVVKAEEWPGPTVMGGGFHQLYHDVDPSFQATAESLLRNLYESNHLKQEIESRVISERESVHSDGEEELETMSKTVCALCRTPDKPDLKVCAACRRIAYCSKECQRNDWQYHKRECKSKKAT